MASNSAGSGAGNVDDAANNSSSDTDDKDASNRMGHENMDCGSFTNKFMARLDGESNPTGYTCTYDAHTTDGDDSDSGCPNQAGYSSFYASSNDNSLTKRSSLKHTRKLKSNCSHSQNLNLHHRSQHVKQNSKLGMATASSGSNSSSQVGVSDLGSSNVKVPTSSANSSASVVVATDSGNIKSCLVRRSSFSDEESAHMLSGHVTSAQDGDPTSTAIQGMHYDF